MLNRIFKSKSDKPELMIVGTIGLDDIETPFGRVQGVLGGSATYASYAASFFARPGIVSIVGEDFPAEHEKTLTDRGISIKGLAREGKTFRWGGFYEFDMNEAKTLRTELNTLETFKADVPDEYRDIELLFLANLDPELQLKVISQMRKPKFIIMDTMNFWISHKKKELLEAISKVNLLVINDGEARQLFNTVNLVTAARKALDLGPDYVIIKKGEHGSLLFSKKAHFNAPGYPLESVKDPTGCGDSFGGSLAGYLAKTRDTSEKNIRKGIVYGSVVASFNAEGFSLENLKSISNVDIEKRFEYLKQIRNF